MKMLPNDRVMETRKIIAKYYGIPKHLTCGSNRTTCEKVRKKEDRIEKKKKQIVQKVRCPEVVSKTWMLSTITTYS